MEFVKKNDFDTTNTAEAKSNGITVQIMADDLPSVVLPSDAAGAGRCLCRDTSCDVPETADDRSGRVGSGGVHSRTTVAVGGNSA